jgi:hypothetical protein
MAVKPEQLDNGIESNLSWSGFEKFNTVQELLEKNK